MRTLDAFGRAMVRVTVVRVRLMECTVEDG